MAAAGCSREAPGLVRSGVGMGFTAKSVLAHGSAFLSSTTKAAGSARTDPPAPEEEEEEEDEDEAATSLRGWVASGKGSQAKAARPVARKGSVFSAALGTAAAVVGEEEGKRAQGSSKSLVTGVSVASDVA